MKLFLKLSIAIGLLLLVWRFWPSPNNTVSVHSQTNELKPTEQIVDHLLHQTADSSAQKEEATVAQLEPLHLCLQPEHLTLTLTKLQQQRVNLTNQLIDSHEQLGIEKALTLQVLQAVGGDLEVFQFRQAPRKKFNFPRFEEDIAPHLDEQQSAQSKIESNTMLKVQVAIAKQDYDALLQIIHSLSISDRRLLFTHPQQSLLGLVMIKDPQIPLNMLQQLIDAGIKPNLADLAALTALDFPIALIAMLQQHFPGNLQQQWQDNFRSYNLSLLAAENASTELFEYWLAQGIPVQVAPQAPNAFDLIPLPTSEQQLQQQIGKVRRLLTAGVLPRALDVRAQWLLLLPAQEALQMSDLLQHQTTPSVDPQEPDAPQRAALQQLQAEFNQLLQQVAACPKAQQWPAGLTVSRDFPERRYLKQLRQRQQAQTKLEQMSEQDLDNHKLITEFIQKKDWVNAQILIQQLSTFTPEEANFELLMVMMMEVANLQDMQRQLTYISQLNEQQIKMISELASSEQRELFKAAGFELPFSDRAEEFHRHRKTMEQ